MEKQGEIGRLPDSPPWGVKRLYPYVQAEKQPVAQGWWQQDPQELVLFLKKSSNHLPAQQSVQKQICFSSAVRLLWQRDSQDIHSLLYKHFKRVGDSDGIRSCPCLFHHLSGMCAFRANLDVFTFINVWPFQPCFLTLIPVCPCWHMPLAICGCFAHSASYNCPLLLNQYFF